MVSQHMLSKLNPGAKARICGISGESKLKRKLLDMGIVPGTRVEVLSLAPFGDPMDVCIKGYQLSLRKDEAQQIIVEVEDI